MTLIKVEPKLNWHNWLKDCGFTLASVLYEPMCKVRELYYTVKVWDHWTPQETGKKRVYKAGVAVCAVTAVVTTPFAFIAKSIPVCLQKTPFHYCTSDAPLTETRKGFSLYMANVCCPWAGYAISDGGVTPSQYRLDNLVSHIIQQNQEVVCLLEIFDILTAHELIKGLAHKYRSFFYFIGAHHLGPSSGMFVASRIKMTNPAFEYFSRENLSGRSKKSNKGFFMFDVAGMQVCLTHMGHSEIPSQPTQEEVNARCGQRNQILEHLRMRGPAMLTGDLNLDTNEFDMQNWGRHFDRGNFPKENGNWTWGGDEFMARIVDKTPSGRSVLDYSMLFKNGSEGNIQLNTEYLDVGFRGDEFRVNALSDHKPLLSEVIYEESKKSD